MARGWHYAKLSLSNAPRLSFSGMCVCVFSSYSFWTSSSLDVPAGVTQEEGHTGFFIHLLFEVCGAPLNTQNKVFCPRSRPRVSAPVNPPAQLGNFFMYRDNGFEFNYEGEARESFRTPSFWK